jgi:hypothetical protein
MSFDIDDFMSANFTESSSTKAPIVPPGDYLATIIDDTREEARDWEKISGKQGIRTKVLETGEEDNWHWMLAKIPFRIIAPSVPEANDRLVSMTIFMDVLQEDHDLVRGGAHPAGYIDFAKGKNVKLGRLREAVHQNEPGVPWNIRMLAGQQAIVHVEHEMNKNNGQEFAAVTRVTEYTGEAPA